MAEINSRQSHEIPIHLTRDNNARPSTADHAGGRGYVDEQSPALVPLSAHRRRMKLGDSNNDEAARPRVRRDSARGSAENRMAFRESHETAPRVGGFSLRVQAVAGSTRLKPWTYDAQSRIVAADFRDARPESAAIALARPWGSAEPFASQSTAARSRTWTYRKSPPISQLGCTMPNSA